MTTDKKAIGTMSIDVKLVLDRIMQLKVGEVVEYAELTALIGRDVRTRARWVLDSARRVGLGQGVTFAIVAKVGVKRLADAEICSLGANMGARIHRIAKNTGRKLSTVQDYNALSNEKKIEYNTGASLAGILAHVTKRPQVKRLEAAVAKSQSSLPLQKTLDAFSG